jgi:hypothetical protein
VITKVLILDGKLKHLCLTLQDDDYEFHIPFRSNHSVKHIAASVHSMVMVFKFSRGINEESEVILDWWDL